jgi:hypothetical protein
MNKYTQKQLMNQGVSMNKYLKVKIDWYEIAKTVNEKFGRDFSLNFIRDVYRGRSTSSKVKECIHEIIKESLSKPIKVDPKKLIKEEV